MHSANVFRISSIQCVVFTPNLEIRSSQLLKHLFERWGDRFNGQPLTIPLPLDAPPQIPSIILTSIDNSLKMEVSKARTAVIWVRTHSEGDPDVPVVVGEFCEILHDFLAHTHATPGRLATIIHRFLPMENTGRWLAEHFCKDIWLAGPLDRPQNFELHAHKRYRLARQFNVNSWVRVKTGILTIDRSSIVLVEQDINTLAEELETQRFGRTRIRRFFDITVGEFDQIFALYFPEFRKER